jgi:hypothetical protein
MDLPSTPEPDSDAEDEAEAELTHEDRITERTGSPSRMASASFFT